MANALVVEHGQQSFAISANGRMFFYKPSELYKARYRAKRAKDIGVPESELHSYRKIVRVSFDEDKELTRGRSFGDGCHLVNTRIGSGSKLPN